VRVTVHLPSGSIVARDGSGAGHGIDVDLGQAHESALKEAETDAMKRALMTFGNPFGLALYDKEQRAVGEVDTPSTPSTPSTPTAAPAAPAAPPRPRPTSPSPAPARPTPTRPTKPTPPIRRTPAQRTPAPTWISSQPATSSPPV
jgi:hypothetical protein